MSTVYNLEDAIQKMPAVLEDVENLINTEIPNVITALEEGGKEVGAQSLIDDCNSAIQQLEALKDLIQQLLGEEGDSVTNATLYGAFAAMKKMQATLNGD